MLEYSSQRWFLFQSTLPLRGATYSYWISPSVQIFQSTLPLRGATFSMRLVQHIVSISIHTPLAGSDGTARPWSRPCGNFNPHSPCGERQYAYRHPSVKVEISIHTPLAGSDEAGAAVLVKADVISIHTPLAGSDSLLCGRYQYNKFQSTLPLRGATHLLPGQPRGKPISIHTPLAGSDHAGTARKGWALYFNPHSPCGERLAFCFNRPHSSIFQSTLPLRGATSRLLRSIRVPKYFNPHSPCGERPYHDADQAVG